MSGIYLDNNASTQIDSLVIERMNDALIRYYANPSSLYAPGQVVSAKILEVRELIAKQINCTAQEIFFTASGTEANNLCIKGYAFANRAKGNHMIISKIEHPSVKASADYLTTQGFEITYLDVDADGFVDPHTLEKAIRDDTILISIGHVNNEIGTIQAIEKLSRICPQIPFHTDAVQSFLKIPFDVEKLNLALATFSGHKIHGPKGIGFIYKRNNIQLEKQIHGGQQEGHLRAGTENVAAILGLGAAIEYYDPHTHIKMKGLQKYLIDQLTAIGARINGPIDLNQRVCTNINFCLDAIEGETLLRQLSQQGIYVSTGSACSSKSSKISPVLQAIGCPTRYIHGNLRIGLSKFTSQGEIDQFLQVLRKTITARSNMALTQMPLYT